MKFLTTAIFAALTAAAHAEQPKLPVGVAVDGQAGWSAFAQAVQQPTMILRYIDLSLPKSQWKQSAQYEANQTSAFGNVTPILGLPMASRGEDADTSFRAIANGSQDGVIDAIFQAFVDAGYPGFYLRPGFEMNGSWMPWYVTPGNVNDYIAAFQRIAALAHAFHGALISVVWNPNVGGNMSLASMYPGDASVDVVGIDTYGSPINNPMSPADTSGNCTLRDAMQFAADHGKLFAIPEAGSADTTFPVQLGIALAQSPVKLAFVAVWDTNAACGGCLFGPGDGRAAAWQNTIAMVEGRAATSALQSSVTTVSGDAVVAPTTPAP